ncbi:two-partner secretion domain-containing protein [Phormidesmis priestleyi]
MAQRQIFKRYWAGWASIVGGTLLTFQATVTLAQNITLDGTLGTAETLTGTTYTVPQSVGQTVGTNLFHSFGRFDLDTGEVANFQSAANIRNIFARVTGGVRSSIDGLIQTESGNVNLFLLNPSGIFFGANAQLNVGDATRGSFVATTVDAIVFPNGGQFSATNPSGVDGLLTLVGDPSGFLATQRPSTDIVSTNSVLATYQEQSLVLLGGSVALNRTRLFALGGRIELGGVAEAGTVGLDINDNVLSLSFPARVERSNVSLSDNSLVRVTADDKGSIAVNARNIDLAGRSIIDAGIAPNSGSANSQSGNIALNASGAVTLLQRSLVRNILFPGAIGNSGNITINADSLAIKEGSQLAAGVLGQGNGGNISVLLNNEALIDGSSNSFPSGLLTPIGAGGLGNAGNITIAAKSLTLSNGGQIQTLVSGQGIGGSVTIQSKDAVVLDGTGGSQLRSGIFSDIEPGGTGKGGNIEITTGSLGITKGAGIVSGAVGTGDAGNVKIQANTTVSLDGTNNDETFISGVVSNLEGSGRGGKIEVKSGSLSITNGAALSASTFGQGNAGDVAIQTQNNVLLRGKSRSGFSSGVFSSVELGSEGDGGAIQVEADTISVENGAQLSTRTNGRGNAGNIIIKAHDFVSFIGEESSALTNVASRGIGKGGNIDISANFLKISTGAQLFSATFGQGDAGNIQIVTANSTNIFGSSLRSGRPSGLAASTGSFSKGGDITISSPFFRLSEGAVLDARTLAEGAGGNININTASFDAINGGQLVSTTESSGQAGRITINALNKVMVSGSDSTFTQRSVLIPNLGYFYSPNSGLFVRSQGSGIAGDIEINTPRLTLDNQGKLNAESASGNGGNITLNIADLMLLRRDSQISTTAGTAQAGGNGGNIQINAPLIVAVPRENSDITANAFTGAGGRVEISADSILGIQPRPVLTPLSDITASSNFGVQGVVAINTPDVDPSRGLVPLPTNLVDPSSQIAQGCSPNSPLTASRFVATGRGGLPDSPDDALSSDTTLTRLTTPVARSTTSTNHSDTPSAQHIVEAQGFIRLSDGKIRFVAQAADVTPHRNWQTAPRCDSSARQLQTVP